MWARLSFATRQLTRSGHGREPVNRFFYSGLRGLEHQQPLLPACAYLVSREYLNLKPSKYSKKSFSSSCLRPHYLLIHSRHGFKPCRKFEMHYPLSKGIKSRRGRKGSSRYLARCIRDNFICLFSFTNMLPMHQQQNGDHTYFMNVQSFSGLL